MDVQQYVTMAAMKRIMSAYQTFNPLALTVTYGDIWRLPPTQAGLETAELWEKTFKEDRRKVARMAESKDWSDDEKYALRALYQSKTNQITHCKLRGEEIKLAIRNRESLSDMIDRIARENDNDPERPYHDIPF